MSFSFTFQPGIILMCFGLLLLLVPEKFRKLCILAGPVLTFAATLYMQKELLLENLGLAQGQSDQEARLVFLASLIFATMTLVGGTYNLHSTNRQELGAEAVYAGSSLGVVFSTTWISMLIYWELMAVASWLIVLSSKTKESAKAGFRYLVLHMLGGNLLLCGVAIKLSQGSTLIASLTGQQDLAYWFILLGVAVNTAIPPLHTWVADAYPRAPLGGTVYMATYTTKIGVFCLIRLFAGTEMLIYFGVIMALYGAAMALIENNLRRLFSYHIISQVGYMVVALAVGSQMGVDGAAAHLLNHILYKSTLLMCCGAVIMATGKEKISELGGLAKKMPVTAGCFLLASLSIAGFPLFNGFISKGLIMNAIAEGNYHLCELLMMLASVGTLLSITLKVNYFVFFGKTDKEISADEKMIPANMKVAMIFGAASCLLTGIFPQILYNILPYQTETEAFTVDHVTQYVELFAAAAIAFVMYIEHMAPKDKLTLDFDWFYRKPLLQSGMAVSVCAFGFLTVSGRIMKDFIEKGNRILHDPQILLPEFVKAPKAARLQSALEDDDVLQRPAGSLVGINILLVLVILAILFLMKILG